MNIIHLKGEYYPFVIIKLLIYTLTIFKNLVTKELLMLTNIIISIYRVLAGLMIASPIAINVLLNGGILMSFIYIPLLCLFLSIFAIYADKKLLDILLSMKPVKIRSDEESQSEEVSSLY